MEFTAEHVHGIKHAMKVIQQINVMRKYAGIILLFELVGCNGNQLTQCERIEDETSYTCWKDLHESEENPNARYMRAWNELLLCMSRKKVKR